MIDIFGDHYFKCKLHSKIWLHNRVRDYNAKWLEHIAKLSGLSPSSQAIVTEPMAISCNFPSIQPLDIRINSLHGIKGIDITILGAPTPAREPHTQADHTLSFHAHKEVLKWR
eukprot:1561868-Ditylum_brightwellii.AAC.1